MQLLIQMIIEFVSILLNDVPLIFRSRKLRTASNRLLLSLLSADFVILLCCYAAASQGLQRSPFLGKLGSDNYHKSNWYEMYKFNF